MGKSKCYTAAIRPPPAPNWSSCSWSCDVASSILIAALIHINFYTSHSIKFATQSTHPQYEVVTLKSVLSFWHFSQREPLSFLWELLIFHQYNVTQSHSVSIYWCADCFESKFNLHMVQFSLRLSFFWRDPAQLELLFQHSLQSAVSSRKENLCLLDWCKLIQTINNIKETTIFNEWCEMKTNCPHPIHSLNIFQNKGNVAVYWIFMCVFPWPAAFREIHSPSQDTHIIHCNT